MKFAFNKLVFATLALSAIAASSQTRRPGAEATGGRDTGPVRSSPSRAFHQILRLQVELDRLGFSPGCIDGKSGSQTTEALRAWQRQQGLRDRGAWDETVSNRFAGVTNYLADYVVTSGDLAGLAPVPKTWLEKSVVPAMAYETVREKLAEKFHAKESLLQLLNPKLEWPSPPAGSVVVVPNADSGQERLPKASRLEVNIDRKYIEAFDSQGRIIAHFPCSIAQKVEKRPRGETSIVVVAPNPNYTFDPELFADDPEVASIHSKLIIPPGPNNPVGVAWIGLGLPGYGMHGTPRPEDIGHTESHGCFRLQNWNAQRLIKIVSVGLPVTVIRSD
jgi:lipoprotein-anchoring transpeptidase ErfK/SrfK